MTRKDKPTYEEIEVNGIKVKYRPEICDDIDFFENLIAFEDGSSQAGLYCIQALFGEHYKDLKDKLRGKDGLAKTADVGRFFYATLAAKAKGKNSSGSQG
jgi:hypothetical protein